MPTPPQSLLALAVLTLLACHGHPGGPRHDGEPERAATAPAPAVDLAFHEMMKPGVALRPAEKVLALAGRRVHLVGYMAQMELLPRGGFFLTGRPLHCDEAGGGTADLPPETVFVIASSMQGMEVPWLKGPLEMTGTLEVGNQADEDGRVSAFRLRLDGAFEMRLAPSGSPSTPFAARGHQERKVAP